MGRNVIETVMGAVVLVIAGGFLYTAYQGRSIGQVTDGVRVTAIFDDVSGIGVGSDVRIGGVKVGVVEEMKLDPKSYRAKLELVLSGTIPVPEDSSASITADGLLGSKFVAMEVGGSDAMLKDGAVIDYTQSSISLERLLGKFIFGGKKDDEEDEAEE